MPDTAYAPLRLRPALRSSAGVLVAAAIGLASASCTRADDSRAQADADHAALQTDAALNRAAADTRDTVDDLAASAKPTLDRAAHDAKRGVDTLALAAGRATVKAGAALEHAGARGRARDAESSENSSDR